MAIIDKYDYKNKKFRTCAPKAQWYHDRKGYLERIVSSLQKVVKSI